MVFWVAFDMDSTLGYFSSLTNYLLCLYPEDLKEIESDSTIEFNIKADWRPKIDAAFDDFIKRISENGEIIKVLRPGIIQIIEILLKAKSEGKVGGLMIYSNNPQKRMLYLVNKLICHILGVKKVFCPLVHSGDPIRGDENITNIKQTETIIRSFLIAGLRDGCGNGLLKRKDLIPSNILFFDDLIHEHIYNSIPHANYFRVDPYVIYPNHKEIHAEFLWALMSHDLDKNKEYLEEVKKLGFDFNNVSAVFKSFKDAQPTGDNVNIKDELMLLYRVMIIINGQ